MRSDPTRTGMIRRAYERDIGQRFRAIKQAVVTRVVEEDAFGLLPAIHVVANAEKQAWRFHTNEEKLKAFRQWITPLVDAKLLAVDGMGKPWTAKYVESAYKKGAIRSYIDSKGKKLKGGAPAFFAGTQAEFLRSAFAQPERISKVKFLATRSYEEMRGVSAYAATQLNRVLANGLVQGQSPREIASTMAEKIEGVSKTRALVIARTEIIAAHAEGQLDSFEDLGVDEVGVLAEWSTADDDAVCEECGELEGTTMTVDEARGLIPRHPNCRCAWIPSTEAADRTRLKAAVKSSIKAGGGTLKEATAKSSWAGKLLLSKLGKKKSKDDADEEPDDQDGDTER